MSVAISYFIVGLGNPGPEYARTRHNVGFMVLDQLAYRHSIRLSAKSRLAIFGEGEINGKGVLLAQPRTFMNLSGQAVTSLRTKYNIPLNKLVVLVDDFSIPLGRIRLRAQGSNGGHNGLANIIECVGSKEFTRIRFGIGPPYPGRDPIDFVLGKFRPEELEPLNSMIQSGADAVESLLEDGLERTMNKFNGTN